MAGLDAHLSPSDGRADTIHLDEAYEVLDENDALDPEEQLTPDLVAPRASTKGLPVQKASAPQQEYTQNE